MDVQAFHRTALLTPPAISFKHSLLIISYSPLASLSLGCFWRSAEIRLLCMAGPKPSFLRDSRQQESQHKSSPGSNPWTYRIRASAPRFQGPAQSRAIGFCKLEREEFPRLALFAGHVLLDRALKFFSRQLSGFVHPGCTIEPLTVRTRHSYELSRFGPSDLLEIALRYPRQVLMDGFSRRRKSRRN